MFKSKLSCLFQPSVEQHVRLSYNHSIYRRKELNPEISQCSTECIRVLRNNINIFLNKNLPIRASIKRAVTDVAPLAVYTPRANKDRPPAAAKVLSQSVTRALRPVPMTFPAVLQKNVCLSFSLKHSLQTKNLNWVNFSIDHLT